MLKKRMLIVLGMAAVLSASCVSATVWAEENTETQTESETETTDESVTENDSTEENGEETAEADAAEEETPEIQEGYTTELEGCTKVVPGVKMAITIFTVSFTILQILMKRKLIQWLS